MSALEAIPIHPDIARYFRGKNFARRVDELLNLVHIENLSLHDLRHFCEEKAQAETVKLEFYKLMPLLFEVSWMRAMDDYSNENGTVRIISSDSAPVMSLTPTIQNVWRTRSLESHIAAQRKDSAKTHYAKVSLHVTDDGCVTLWISRVDHRGIEAPITARGWHNTEDVSLYRRRRLSLNCRNVDTRPLHLAASGALSELCR